VNVHSRRNEPWPFNFPSAETPMSREYATWTPLRLRAPLCHVRFGTSRIAEYSLQVFCCWNPRLSNPRCSGFVPPVSLGVDGPDQIAGSHFAIFNVHEVLALANPDSPICDGQGFLGCLRVNSLEIQRSGFAICTTIQFVDSLPYEEISVPPPSSCATSTRSTSPADGRTILPEFYPRRLPEH
jgi:hypothetical protein